MILTAQTGYYSTQQLCSMQNQICSVHWEFWKDLDLLEISGLVQAPRISNVNFMVCFLVYNVAVENSWMKWSALSVSHHSKCSLLTVIVSRVVTTHQTIVSFCQEILLLSEAWRLEQSEDLYWNVAWWQARINKDEYSHRKMVQFVRHSSLKYFQNCLELHQAC